jgi:hypothetical protein
MKVLSLLHVKPHSNSVVACQKRQHGSSLYPQFSGNVLDSRPQLAPPCRPHPLPSVRDDRPDSSIDRQVSRNFTDALRHNLHFSFPNARSHPHQHAHERTGAHAPPPPPPPAQTHTREHAQRASRYRNPCYLPLVQHKYGRKGGVRTWRV